MSVISKKGGWPEWVGALVIWGTGEAEVHGHGEVSAGHGIPIVDNAILTHATQVIGGALPASMDDALSASRHARLALAVRRAEMALTDARARLNAALEDGGSL